MINKYMEFCQIHSLKQLITINNTSTLTDHILTNSTEKSFNSV